MPGAPDSEPRGGRRFRPELLKELLRRRDADQAARASLIAYDATSIRQLIRIDDDNTAWLKTIVDPLGWPGWSLVGEDGSHAAWLLVQHADRDRPFQRRCLELLQEAASLDEASPGDVAHLTDRVLLADGKRQVYGTQLTARDGRFVAPRLRDPATVDARRAAVGMGTLEDHLARALDLYGPPVPARVPCISCSKPVELWLPELGGKRAIQCGSCGFKTTVHARITSATIVE